MTILTLGPENFQKIENASHKERNNRNGVK